MQMDIIRIGNSKGIRIPLAVLKQCGIDSKVELEVEVHSMVEDVGGRNLSLTNLYTL